MGLLSQRKHKLLAIKSLLAVHGAGQPVEYMFLISSSRFLSRLSQGALMNS